MKHTSLITKKTIIFILLSLTALGGCARTETQTSPPPTIDTPLIDPTVSPTATATVEPEAIYPYYLPLATKPDIPAQTLNGVTASVDWAYADESRVAVKYTITGLDLDDGQSLDPFSISLRSDNVLGLADGGGGGGVEPSKNGIISGNLDLFFTYGQLDAAASPEIRLTLDIPIHSTTPIYPPTFDPNSQTFAPEVGEFHFKFSIPVLDGFTQENLNQIVSNNNVTMTLKKFVLNPSYAMALVCFSMPSPVDWGLSASVINVDGTDYPSIGFGLLPGTSGREFTLDSPERCVTAGFDVPYVESPNTLTLTIPFLSTSMPEVITEEMVIRANERLAGEGIEFKYITVDHGGYPEILKRPEGMPDTELYPKIFAALAERYDGPWEFTIPLDK